MSNSKSGVKLKDIDLLRTESYLFDGWRAARLGTTIPVLNPANGQVITQVASLGADETEAAIAGAVKAQVQWRKLTAQARARLLQAWYAQIMQHAEDIAQLMTAEQGKPLAESRGEVNYAASFVEWFAEEGKRTYGDTIPAPAADKRLFVIKQPIGVCAAITPWNFPAAMITRKVAPALAAGCAIIVKPAEETPLTALALAALAERAGIPAGVFQVIVGDARQIGGVLTASPDVRKLSFTGSTEVGRLLMAQSAPTVKRLSLELGGNAPFIVFDDADVDAAVEGAMVSKYRNSGQTCVCANRLLVQAGIYDVFVEKLRAKVAALKIGDGTEDGVQQGPLINQDALDHALALIEDATQLGASVVVGGKAHALGGTFFEPTILRDLTLDMRVAHEEIFAPVAPVFRFETEEQAVAQANDTEYGLAAYLYTGDLARAWRVGEALEYGMVGLNTGLISNEVAPFGGIKQSGLGREGSHYGIDEYLETKYLCLQV
ncbi:NAD-dependent succinate-semialdehyde dehydrogenase [Alcaligenaceae bacterium CGII-47]|nr:NAD-dependent succinate-semialdehyde dehydrogenase [Alcaligenaceae bacterium CGII-47]